MWTYFITQSQKITFVNISVNRYHQKTVLLLINCQAYDVRYKFSEVLIFALKGQILSLARNSDSFAWTFQAHFVHFQENVCLMSKSESHVCFSVFQVKMMFRERRNGELIFQLKQLHKHFAQVNACRSLCSKSACKYFSTLSPKSRVLTCQ